MKDPSLESTGLAVRFNFAISCIDRHVLTDNWVVKLVCMRSKGVLHLLPLDRPFALADAVLLTRYQGIFRRLLPLEAGQLSLELDILNRID